MKTQKRFLTYDQQIQLLKDKKLNVENDQLAKHFLSKYSYYSLISGYKDIFKIQKNGDYKPDASLSKIVHLYLFDEFLRNTFLNEIIKVEKHIKSIYSYNFCLLYGDQQADYLNVNNYNYVRYQKEVNEFAGMVQDLLNNPSKYSYIEYNINEYGTVPLWVIMNAITFGSIAKMYSFSTNKLQSQIAKEFPNVYTYQLNSMLKMLSKYRNVCAHGERLYNYQTRTSLKTLPVHTALSGYNPLSKNDLFNVLICLKYLSNKEDFSATVTVLEELIKSTLPHLGINYMAAVLHKMGFPANWSDIIKL